MVGRPFAQLLPGMHGTASLFRWVARALSPQIETALVSYPTHDVLTVDQLASQVCLQAPPQPYIIVAESYAGAIALAVAANRPAGLRGLVLSTSFVAPPVPSWLRHIPTSALFRLPAPELLLRLLLLEKCTAREVVSEVRTAVDAVSPRVLSARLREVLSRDSSALLISCPVPIAYLAGASDRLVGFRGLRRIQRLRPDIAAITLDGPHLLLQSRPVETASIITRYAQRWIAT